MKKNWKKLVANGLVVVVVIAGLALLAHVLVSNLNLVELIKHMHGG